MKRYTAMLLALLLAQAGNAATLPEEVRLIQDQWAEIKYGLPEDQRVDAFEALAERTRLQAEARPQSAEALIWQGIVLATLAGEKGGLSALGLAKDARKSLERALALDPAALDGSAYTSLGSLYYQVPGWPLGFGNDDKARQFLLKGLEINPRGIDSNFFWGDFLVSEGELEPALEAFRTALDAPPRPGREVADEGRRDEVLQAIARAEKKLASKRGN